MKTVNGDAIDHLMHACRARLSAAARGQIAALGVAIDGPFAATYPADTWVACVKLAAAELFPDRDEVEAQRELGHLRIAVVATSLKGRALFALSRLAPREKGLGRYVARLASGASYTQTRFTVIGPRHYEIWVNDVTGVPGFWWGMLEAGAQHAAGCTDPMTIAARDGDSCTYAIRGA